MKTLRSYALDEWHEAADGFAELVDPTTEETIARASSAGIDFAAVRDHARAVGGPNLRALSFAERGEMLKAASKALYEARDELIDLSVRSTGCTRRDAKFDLDGATGTLAFYGYLAKSLGDGRFLAPDDAQKLVRGARFVGRHVRVPRAGVAVLINAFNFPAWGFAEKAACAWLAGMPVVTKPATSTAWVAERCSELLVDSAVLPKGAFQSIVGSTGDLLSLLDGQDVLAFTGSADTALKLRSLPNLLACNTPVNLEADSLNAAVLAPDVDDDGETMDLFYRDVVREMTQKTGQKCTAVRRILVPAERLDAVQAELVARLEDTVAGDPSDGGTTMGPLATARQLQDAVDGVKTLAEEADLVLGTGERIDGAGVPAGKGYFFGPTLLRARDPQGAEALHRLEVFGPVATLMAYDGSPGAAACLVARAGGTLVVSVYTDDEAWSEGYLASGGAFTGRLYLGSEKMAPQAIGSGAALPMSRHGGPGRAGGGSELGGLAALDLYTQPVALQGAPKMLARLAEGVPAAATEDA